MGSSSSATGFNQTATNPRKENAMPLGRRGLIVPQNTFLEDVIRRSDSLHESFMVGSAEIMDYPVVYCSSGFSQLTGFSRSEVMKESCNAKFLFATSAKKEVAEQIQDALHQKKPCQVEFIGRRKDGSLLWYLLHIAPIHNEDSKIVLFLVTVTDISQYKEPITGNEGAAAHKWVKIKRTLKSERNAFVVAFSKSKEEKNKIRIAQLMVQNNDFIPQYKQQIPKPPKWVILHYSTPRVFWDWFVLFFILYTVSAVPFVICFEFDESISIVTVDCLVDVFFFVDIWANFHTSYVAQDGEIVTDLKQIRRYYLRTWFLADLVTSIPYGLLIFISANTVMVNLISFFKCIRLMRINRVIRKLDNFMNYGVITLMLCVVAFLLFAHWMACVFYLIARNYDGFDEIGWVATLARDTRQPFNVSDSNDRALPTVTSLYVSSLYYCLTSLTTIGFGNISPNTTAEKIFGCITMIIGALYYAVIFGQVTAIVHQAQQQSEKYHGLLDNIKNFQKLYKVPVDLSARILDYFMSTWALTKGVDTDEVLKQCPKDLQSDICIHLNRKVLYNNPAFSSMPMGVMRTIARSFCICHVAPGDRVVHEGDALDVLYFISHGSFEVKQNDCVVGLLGQGDVFGDDICNETTVGKSIADVYALTYSDLHCIDRIELSEILMSYPESGFDFSRNHKLSFNLRGQVKKRTSTVSYTDISPIENKDLQFPLPNRTTRLFHPQRGGRRLSLVQELTQSVEMGAIDAAALLRDKEHEELDNEASRTGNRDKTGKQMSVGAIGETEVDSIHAVERTDTYSRFQKPKEEARLSFSDESTGERDVVQLRRRFDDEMSEVKLKLGRIEEQLSVISSFMLNASRQELKPRPELQTKPEEIEGDDSDPSQDVEESSSPNWLLPPPSRSGCVSEARVSDSRPQKPTQTAEERDNRSPSLIARYGRRKIGTSKSQ